MRRIDHIRKMTTAEMAAEIIGRRITDKYCRSDCRNKNGCPHEMKCCIKWLNEEISEKV